jgi:hypothetical protein
MRVLIDPLNWVEYRERFGVTAWRDGMVFKTVRQGFVKADYKPKEDEILATLSTTIIGKEIEVSE